jgi:hypothetical protein
MPGLLPPLSPGLVYGLITGLFLLVAILGIATLRLALAAQKSRKKLSLFLSGKDGQDLESVLTASLEETKELDQEIQELYEISNRLRDLVLKSVHKTSVLRFNPFKEVGGNQSFSVALLDGKNSGLVFSSLHTREGTRVYAKPVTAGEPDGFPFTDEERQAIHEAIHGKPKNT